MKMIERNKTAEAAALLIHPMLSSAEGIELQIREHVIHPAHIPLH